MKKIVGYALLALCAVVWGCIATLPLLDISAGTAATAMVALLIGGEIAFFIGVALSGTEAWEKMKSRFKSKR
jgi:hypothetical protein